jgi:hypothetical protein
MNTLVAEPIICATKDSPRLFCANCVQKMAKADLKRQLPEKVCKDKSFSGKTQLPEKVSSTLIKTPKVGLS